MKINNTLKNKTTSEKIVYSVVSFLMGLWAASYVFAFFWAFLAGAKNHNDIIMDPFGWPKTWQFANYLEVFETLEVRGVGFFGMLTNTMLRVAVTPVLTIGGQMLLAYALAKYRFPGRALLFGINTVVMTLPIIGGTASNYRLLSSMGLIDNPLLVIAGCGNFGGNLLFFLSCFKGLSNTYMEAARIDGAGHLRIMTRVMFPMAAGTTSALWILQVIALWNDPTGTLLTWPNMPTLATGIYLFNTEMIYRARMDILMAATVISAIPPLIVFSIAHKKLLTSVTFGGIKG